MDEFVELFTSHTVYLVTGVPADLSLGGAVVGRRPSVWDVSRDDSGKGIYSNCRDACSISRRQGREHFLACGFYLGAYEILRWKAKASQDTTSFQRSLRWPAIWFKMTDGYVVSVLRSH